MPGVSSHKKLKNDVENIVKYIHPHAQNQIQYRNPLHRFIIQKLLKNIKKLLIFIWNLLDNLISKIKERRKTVKKTSSTILIIILAILIISMVTYVTSDRPRQDAVNATQKVIENSIP